MSLSIKNSCGGKSLPELTSPASATDIEQGKEAIDGNGNKITGTLGKYANGSIFTTGNISESGGSLVVDVIYNKDKKIIENGNTLSYFHSLGSFGNVAAAEVAAGKTFTSSAGFKVAGTGTLFNLDTASGNYVGSGTQTVPAGANYIIASWISNYTKPYLIDVKNQKIYIPSTSGLSETTDVTSLVTFNADGSVVLQRSGTKGSYCIYF